MTQKTSRINGFTFVEVMVAMGIVATLAAIAIPAGADHIYKARVAAAIADVRVLEKEIVAVKTATGEYPNSLADVEKGNLRDPWGNPYEYNKLTGAPGEKPRKDRFLVPINSDFDLYSMGRDGDSKTPFTAQASRDDIVRANDGGYVGLAENF